MSKPPEKSKPLTSVQRSSKFHSFPIADLVIDPEAQRRLVPNWVKKEITRFDADKLGYIVVNSRANGKLYVIDGQHRVELLRAIGWGDQQILCEYFEGLTQQEEAQVFIGRNNRKAVRTFDNFRVAITAGQEVPCDIDRIVRSQGLVISDQEKDGHIVAVSALERVYRGAGIAVKDGPPALARTLKTVQQAWGRQPSAFHGKILEGVGLVQLKYNGALDQKALADKLAPFSGGSPGLLGKAKSLRELRGHPLHDCVASIVVDLYNKGRRGGKLEAFFA